MRVWIKGGWLLLFLLILQPSLSPARTAPCEGVKRARVTVVVDLSRYGPQDPAELWLPYPVSDRYQCITDVEIKGTFTKHGFYTDRRYGNPILYAYWPRGRAERRLELSFEVLRKERCEGGAPSKEGVPIESVLFADYLQGSRLAPINSELKRLALEITEGKTGTLAKAKAVYTWVAENMRRDPGTRGCGRGDVCLLLAKRSGKCADIHSVFVALLRAARIPAREVFGLRLAPSGEAVLTTSQHCWAEFYVPGYGWYAADPGDYLKALKEKGLKAESAEAKRLFDYYFGAVDPLRVRLSTGRDVELEPPPESGPLNYFMYPLAEVGEIVPDPLNPEAFRYRIVQEAPKEVER